MTEPRATPWNPDRRWADPLIGLLLLLSLLATLEAIQAWSKPRPEPQRPGIQSRWMELRAAALERVGAPHPTPLEGPHYPWDRAVLAILAAEEGNQEAASRLAETAPESFRPIWRAAYRDGSLPPPEELATVSAHLGEGFALHRLQARLAERQRQDPEPMRAQARAWALPRLVILGLGALAVLTLSLVGVVSAGLMIGRGKKLPSPTLEDCPMPWRAAALAFLGWFVALRFSGTVAALLFSFLPLPRVLALPLALSFHVWVGARLLLLAEGVTLRQAWRRMTPGPFPRTLGWAAAFLGIALVSVFLVGWLTQPLLRHAEPPQRELLDLVSGNTHPIATLILFTAMAGIAPLFEEWLFRGTLLPWLGFRFARRWKAGGWILALALTGLLFGAMHLQLAALPSLCTLGIVLGWAFVRTGNLWTTVAMHACWNGAVFMLIRVLA